MSFSEIKTHLLLISFTATIFSTYFVTTTATSANCSHVSLSTDSLFVNLTANFTQSIDEYSHINGTYVAIPNENAKVHLLCEAHYPIEWIQLYNEDGFYTKTVYGERISGNFSDPGSYTYQAVVGLVYTGSICYTSNFTCRSVSNECLQKRVVSHLGPKGAVIRFEVVDNALGKNGSELERTYVEEDTCTVYASCGNSPDSLVPRSKCETATGKTLQLMFVVCDSAMHCNTLYKHVNRGKKCLKILPENHQCLGCAYLSTISYKPGFIVCKDNGVVVLAQHYFHSLTELDKPELYFSWEEADPRKMLLIEQIDNIVYVGQELSVFCLISRYYFSYGHRMAFRYKNGTMNYQPAEDGEHYDTFQANRISLTLNVSLEVDEVFCFAPVWNSTEWVNQSVKLPISEESVKPFLHGSETEAVNWYIGQKNKTIRCSASGMPSPEIEIRKLSWTSVDSDTVYISQMVKVAPEINQTIVEYTFPEVTDDVKGEYICSAKNFRGSASRKIIVTVLDGMLLVILAIMVVSTLVILIFIVIMALCWKKIREQSEEIRLLTEAEVKEFREGNPEAIQKTNYLDTGERIDSLPYNSKFEIPKERLCIDTTSILGSGAFGQVLKGSVIGEQKNGSSLPVAVKTVKQNMELMYFKSLLSEVKIMAYIGKHPNIVSLIGACTQNIRKREIFIAVEFCKNGSLEKFLRTFRETGFLNLVKEDEIHIESTLSGPNPHSYQNCKPTQPISTVHLIKWAREIANGMEYLGSKKIIHGDLAARNILLSDENIAKIGDFGLSRQLISYSNYFTNQQCPLPWKWMAVEALCDMKFSVHTDVWAYGITLWEIFTLAQVPYPGISWSTDFLDHLTFRVITDTLQWSIKTANNREFAIRVHMWTDTHYLIAVLMDDCKVYDLMLDCWNLEPTERPSFQYLKKIFEEILLEITPEEYFNPNNGENATHSAGTSKPEQDLQGYLLPFAF